jgi:hypothetical protein
MMSHFLSGCRGARATNLQCGEADMKAFFCLLLHPFEKGGCGVELVLLNEELLLECEWPVLV